MTSIKVILHSKSNESLVLRVSTILIFNCICQCCIFVKIYICNLESLVKVWYLPQLFQYKGKEEGRGTGIMLEWTNKRDWRGIWKKSSKDTEVQKFVRLCVPFSMGSTLVVAPLRLGGQFHGSDLTWLPQQKAETPDSKLYSFLTFMLSQRPCSKHSLSICNAYCEIKEHVYTPSFQHSDAVTVILRKD
jgi:hypothetical protein